MQGAPGERFQWEGRSKLALLLTVTGALIMANYAANPNPLIPDVFRWILVGAFVPLSVLQGITAARVKHIKVDEHGIEYRGRGPMPFSRHLQDFRISWDLILQIEGAKLLGDRAFALRGRAGELLGYLVPEGGLGRKDAESFVWAMRAQALRHGVPEFYLGSLPSLRLLRWPRPNRRTT